MRSDFSSNRPALPQGRWTVTDMALLDILEFPDPRLREKALPVAEVTDSTRQLIDDMFETMYDAPGIGLAATQVNVHRRLLVADVSEGRKEQVVLINPEIIARDGVQTCSEGCLSVPGISAEVARAERITVRALGRDGQPLELQADGLLAVCIQHEMDHLDGKLFVDYLSPLKRQLIRKRLAKRARAEAAAQPVGA